MINDFNKVFKMRKIDYLVAIGASGEMWGMAAFVSCIFSSVVGIYLTSYGFLSKSFIRSVAIFDYWVLLGTVLLFIAGCQSISLDSYRNKTGIQDIGLALKSMHKNTQNLVIKTLVFFVFVSGFCVSIEFGLGIGLSLIVFFGG